MEQETPPKPETDQVRKLLTNEVIDRYLARAAETVKEVERGLQDTLKLPASSLLLRLQTRG